MTRCEHELLLQYKSEGMAALADENVKVQPTKRLQDMTRMPGEFRGTDAFREAFVIHAVLGRCRPAAANKQMNALRDNHVAAGTLDQFNALEDLLAQHLDGAYFTAHGFTDYRLEQADSRKIYDGIHRLLDTLRGFGYEAFVNSGTLLGLVRGGDLIPHDDDIDLAVILNARTDSAAAAEFKDIQCRFIDAGIDCRRIDSGNAILKLPSIEGFEVDLFPAYGARRGYNIFPYARKQLVYSDVWPLKPCPVSGLPLPARPEVLLTQNYGKDWETPNPRFTFPWGTQKRKFAALLEAFGAED